MLLSTEDVLLGEMLSTMRDRQLRLEAPLPLLLLLLLPDNWSYPATQQQSTVK